jgi:prophage DNA circulation protein
MTEGGRRIVLHEYPNTPNRFVEDLGELPSKFRVQAFVHGETWLEDATALERALKTEGPAVLVMPTLGSISVNALPYTMDASQRSIGEISFNLEFAVGTNIGGPERFTTNVEIVFAEGDAARRALRDQLTTAWRVASDVLTLITGEFDTETLMRRAVSVLSNYVGNEQLAKVLKIASRTELNPASLVRSGALLADTFFGIDPAALGFWQQVSISIPDGDGFEAAIDLTSMGAGDDLALNTVTGASTVNDTISSDETAILLWNENTTLRTVRNQNRKLLIQSNRIGALVLAYEQAANKTYATQDEIRTAREKSEIAYNNIMRVDITDPDSIQSDETVRRAVNAIRLSALTILGTKEQEAHSLSSLDDVTPTTVNVLAYRLYQESLQSADDLAALTQALRSLNPAQNPVDVKGNVEVFKI